MYLKVKSGLCKINDIIINMDNINYIKPIEDTDGNVKYKIDFTHRGKDSLLLTVDEFNSLCKILFEDMQ